MKGRYHASRWRSVKYFTIVRRRKGWLLFCGACVQFIELCRRMGLLATASLAIDGSKFKAVSTRDKNFARNKVERYRAQLEESVAR